MKISRLKYYILLLSCIFILSSGNLIPPKEERTKPSVILMMLHLSTNKIAALKKMGETRSANEVNQDDIDKNASIISDFMFNFKYCPVYFFYDTQYDYIKNKEWQKVAFYDFESLEQNKKISINNLENYIIAEIAYPPAPDYNKVDAHGNEIISYERNYANSRDYGVICYDENFKLLNNTLQYTKIILKSPNSLLKKREGYTCIAAEKFQKKLEKYFKEAKQE